MGGRRQISSAAEEVLGPVDDVVSSNPTVLEDIKGEKEDLFQALRNIDGAQYGRYMELKGTSSHLDEFADFRCMGFGDISIVNGSNTAGSICIADESEAQGAAVSIRLPLISFR